MGKSGVQVTLPAVALARMLRFALVPVGAKALPGGLRLLNSIRVEVDDTAFGGFDADYVPQWDRVGVTIAATDRYRLHFGGHAAEGTTVPGSMLLSAPDVKQALVAAPRTGSDMATLEWDGTSDEATLAWPRSTFKVSVLRDVEFPKWRVIVDEAAERPAEGAAAFSGTYLSDAVRGVSEPTWPVRLRMGGLRPTLVAQSSSHPGPVALGALVMPVRTAEVTR